MKSIKTQIAELAQTSLRIAQDDFVSDEATEERLLSIEDIVDAEKDGGVGKREAMNALVTLAGYCLSKALSYKQTIEK